ncbi:PRD domain protein [Enterococcus faecalis 13-SD-W-01]|nr:PRD domain protein [Enterococcus faecalis 13-SD-W-01]
MKGRSTLNTRQKTLFRSLLEGRKATIQELAEENHVSPRTIRNDLGKIEMELNESGFSFSFVKKPGVGIWFESPEKAEISRTFLLQPGTEIYAQEERRSLLLFMLLINTKPCTLDDLAENVYTSKQVIREDLTFIAELLSHHKLSLVIKPKIGIFVEGEEREKRELLSQTVKERMELKNQPLLRDFFPAQQLRFLSELVEEFEVQHQLPNNGQVFNSIVIHLLFMIIRVKEHASIQLSPEEWHFIRHSHAHGLAKELAEKLTTKLSLRFSEDEVGYLALRIAAFYGASETQKEFLQETTQHIEAIIRALITDVHQIMGYDLSENQTLRENLRLHLKATFTRIASGFHIINPLKEQIMKNYTQLFLIVQTISEEYADNKKWYIPEEEVAYLTVHLQGAIERMNEEPKQQLKTVIICNFGIGVSSFIEAKLARAYPQIKVIGLLGLDEARDSALIQQADFILATAPIEFEKTPVILISPLFEMKDQSTLSHYLRKNPVQEKIKKFDIHQYTNPFLIHVHLKAETQKEVLEKMVRNAENKGLVTSSYLETVLVRENKGSTRIGKSIALPHGDMNEIRHSFISIATLEKPVLWYTDEVQMVILLGLKKQELGNPETKKFFSMIHYLIENQEVFQKVIKEKDKLNVLKLLSHYC